MRNRPILAVAIIAFCGCRQSDAERDPGADRGALAVIDGRKIMQERLEAHARGLPPAVRAAYTSPTGKRQLLDGVIQTEVLVAEARRLGLDRDPEVVRATNQILIDKLLATKGASAATQPPQVSDVEAERYYREHLSKFQQSERVRVSQILVADQALARKLAAAARSAPRRNADAYFAKLVKEHSVDERTRSRDGDSGLFDRQDGRHPAALVAAAFALEAPGDVAVTEQTERGFFVLRLTEKRPPGPAAFEEVKEEIISRLGQKSRAGRVQAVIDEIKGRAKIQVFDDRVAAVDLAAASAAKPSR